MQTQLSFAAEHRSFINGALIDQSQISSMKNWYPVSICDQTLDVFWRDLGEQKFHASFFQNTLNEQARSQRRVCKTSINVLGQFSNFVEPTAFVFHVSRCGSTLMTQMLSTLAHCIVLSEPPVIDIFFRTYKEFSEKNVRIFQQLIAALGQKRFDNERNLIIKLDSWHLGRIDFIRAAFPQTPMLFLYREPQQVLASHRRQRGPQMIPDFVDMGNLQVDRSDLSPSDLDAYCLRVLDQFYATAIEHYHVSNLQLINYSDLPKLVWEKLLDQLSITCSTDELGQVKARSQFHSKNTDQSFHGDPPSQIEHIDIKKTLEFYQRLESLRQSQSNA